VFLAGFCLQGITGIAKAHMKDVGIDATYIASILSFSSLTLACFKFLTGFVYDKLGLRFTSTMCSVTAAIVTFMLAFLDNSPLGMAMALIYCVFKSLALPLETIMLPIYASDLFGERSYEKILGLFVSVNVTGYALGVPALNLCYDMFGTYTPMLIACAIIMVVVTIVIQYVISTAHKIRKEVTEMSESKLEEVAKELDVPVLARIPINPATAALVDKGAIELADDKYVADAVDFLSKMD
jgi:MFS family permease